MTEAEGIALRPGPRPHISSQVIETLRTAIKSCQKVTFEYQSRSSGEKTLRNVSPLGFIYGHRHYLVAEEETASGFKFFSLPSISNLKLDKASFERKQSFILRDLISNSFGVFEEDPSDVVWRFSSVAAPLAKKFLFHPSQVFENDAEGRLIVRFRAGGLLEMAWHLVKWGEHVEVLAPPALIKLMPEMPIKWPALP